MQIIKCTGKLQKEMGLKKKDLVPYAPDSSILGSWHANLIYIDRRKCLLFTNDMTLFNFLVPDAARQQIKDLASLFRGYLECVLNEEGISDIIIEKIMKEYTEIGYSKTDSKRVLGSMNDLAFHYKFGILDAGGIHSYKIPQIIKDLNRMPMGTIEYKFPIDLLKEACEAKI
jgi:hypothetical protein